MKQIKSLVKNLGYPKVAKGRAKRAIKTKN